MSFFLNGYQFNLVSVTICHWYINYQFVLRCIDFGHTYKHIHKLFIDLSYNLYNQFLFWLAFQSNGNAPHLRHAHQTIYCIWIFSLVQVYESNSDRTEMLGSIQGPCEVLPSDKFKQENDRRCQLENEPSARVQPIFLCRFVSVYTYYSRLSFFSKPVSFNLYNFRIT